MVQGSVRALMAACWFRANDLMLWKCRFRKQRESWTS